MRIALVSQFFPPETAAGARRAGALAGALARRHEVCVFTLRPGYPEPEAFAGVDVAAVDRGLPFEIVRGPAFRPHEASLTRRAWRELAMSRALVKTARRPGAAAARWVHPDLVLVTTPSMFLAPPAWWWARRRGARFAWDVRDLTWRYARETASANGAQRAALGALEGAMLGLLRRTDLVIAATDGLADALRRQRVPESRMVTLVNGVSRALLDTFAHDAPRPPHARPRVTYVGLMGYNHGIGVMVDVARRLPQADVVLVGDGPQRPAIAARLAAGEAPNLTLCGYVTDPAAIAEHYRASDVLVSHTRSTPILDEIVFPAKTYEYFATRRPVVHAGRSYAADRLRERDLAEVVPPEDPDALAAGIARVLADPARAAERAARARAVVETEFCRETQLEWLVEEIERRFGGNAAR